MPQGPYSTQTYADQLSGFLGAIGIERAHVAGVSLGAAVAAHFAARYPDRVRSLSLHSAWDRTDAYLRTIVGLWRSLAGALPAIADVVIHGIFAQTGTVSAFLLAGAVLFVGRGVIAQDRVRAAAARPAHKLPCPSRRRCRPSGWRRCGSSRWRGLAVLVVAPAGDLVI
jgi:pimeloyl-ACP methyl ester carboxylesterase